MPREEPEEDWKEWLKERVPDGTVVPPPASRETVRIPNLNSPSPSFDADPRKEPRSQGERNGAGCLLLQFAENAGKIT